jgi:hypothetical protein
LFVVAGYSGRLSANGESLTLKNDKGVVVKTTSYVGSPSAAQNQLRITEVMFNPRPAPAGSPYINEDFEYIELRNVGATPLNLTGIHFGSGVTFNFTGGTLAGGAYTVLVRNVAAFQSRYGSSIPIGGTFTGFLDNAGENLELQDARNEKIVSVDYQPGWYKHAGNGEGFSIVVRNDAGTFWKDWDKKESWRGSQLVNGNPGAADTGLNPNSVVISEVMSSGSAAVGGNWVELKNQTGQDIPVGGWFLSDSATNLKKWTIPAGSVVPANGHLVLNQTGGFGGAFALSPVGGAVYLSNSDGAGNLAGYRDSVDFAGAAADTSFGRYIKSTGASDFVAMKRPTRGQENTGTAPVVGPLVITEMMYRPLVGQQEFIELRNISGSAVSLAGWAFTDGVGYTFPAGAQMAPTETILVVGIDPAVFRTQYAIPAGIQIFGPYTGVLSGGGEGVELSRPGTPVGGTTPMIRVDRVSYEDDLPWPAAADGLGPSIARIINQNYGNDVANWRSEVAGGTPGRINNGAPYAFEAALVYGATGPQIVIRFSEDVGTSLQGTDLVVTRLSDNQPLGVLPMSYNPLTYTATWTLPTTLLDSNYRLAISEAAVADGSANLLDGNLDGLAGGNLSVQGHHLAGDLNGDRNVDYADFSRLYANFGQSGKSFPDGDLNFDTKVDFLDFQMLERQFGKVLAAAPAAPVAAEPVVSPVSSTGGTRPAPTLVKRPAPIPAPAVQKAPAVAAIRPSFSAKRIQPAKRSPNELLA